MVVLPVVAQSVVIRVFDVAWQQVLAVYGASLIAHYRIDGLRCPADAAVLRLALSAPAMSILYTGPDLCVTGAQSRLIHARNDFGAVRSTSGAVP